MNKLILILISTVLLTPLSIFSAQSDDKAFLTYLDQIKKRAHKAGVSDATLNKYLSNIKPPPPKTTSDYIHNQTHQAAKVLPFETYKKQFTPEKNIEHATKQYIKYLPLLRRIEKKYHVQPRFLVAIWGIESDYGRITGKYPLVESLAILGYHHHRTDFYQQQLIDALIMLNRKKVIPEQLKSAWDGGMGQTQFEPSTYLSFAVDFSNDNFADIWTNMPDIFASIANFLHENGWNGKQTWGIKVKVPAKFDTSKAYVKNKHPVSYWRHHGVLTMDGKKLPKVKGLTAILLPEGINGQAYLIYPNFKVLLRWNNIYFEGLSIGLLSNEIEERASQKLSSH